MFGLIGQMKEAKLAAELEVAILTWLLEANNPVMNHVPALLKPAIVAEVNDLLASAKVRQATAK